MTNQHPLTDEIMHQILDSIPKLPCDEHGELLSYDGQRVLDGMFEELDETVLAEMRTTADWQLEQVMKWLDENLTNYSDADYLGDGRYHRNYCEPLHKLEGDLKKAMRPQDDN